jgi:transcriptional regulator with XRE-family HTH domain
MDNYKKFRKKLGKRLKSLREEKKFTQEYIALEINVDTSFIGRIERAQRIPSLKTIFLLSDVFEMPISQFLEFNS